MSDDPALTAFAQQLIPEAFARRHTAYRVERVEPPLAAGLDGFDRWVEQRLRDALLERYPNGYRPDRIVIVDGDDGIRWLWDGDASCPASRTVNGVRREARPIDDPWLFAIELPWPEPTLYYWDDEYGQSVTLSRPAWLETIWRATWYAEARGRGVASVRAGTVVLDYDPYADHDTQLLRWPVPVREDPVAARFHRILYGHPARKAHPLRRR